VHRAQPQQLPADKAARTQYRHTNHALVCA
jgi:hypothetical protein